MTDRFLIDLKELSSVGIWKFESTVDLRNKYFSFSFITTVSGILLNNVLLHKALLSLNFKNKALSRNINSRFSFNSFVLGNKFLGLILLSTFIRGVKGYLFFVNWENLLKKVLSWQNRLRKLDHFVSRNNCLFVCDCAILLVTHRTWVFFWCDY